MVKRLNFKEMNANRLFKTFLLTFWATQIFAQIETKLQGTDLTGAWHLTSITARCPENDSIWRPEVPPTVLTFKANGQMSCTDPTNNFFGGMAKWKIIESGMTLALTKNSSEGNSFQPIINADGDLLLDYQYHSEHCGMVPVTVVYHRKTQAELDKEAAAKAAAEFVPNPNDPVFAENEVDSLPFFGRGESSLIRYTAMNLNYPALARENSIQGTVLIEFIVEKDGSRSNYKVINEVNGGCSEEALRVLKAMPKWISGMKGGEPVRVRKQVPILFKLG